MTANVANKQSAAIPQPVADDFESVAAYAVSARDILGTTAINVGAVEAPDTFRNRHDSMVTRTVWLW